MNRYAKALVAALTAGAGSLAVGLANGALSVPEAILALAVALAAGLSTAGVSNAGFVDAKQVASIEKLAEAAYTAYATKRGGVAPNGDPLPAWSDVEGSVRDAWVSGQTA